MSLQGWSTKWNDTLFIGKSRGTRSRLRRLISSQSQKAEVMHKFISKLELVLVNYLYLSVRKWSMLVSFTSLPSHYICFLRERSPSVELDLS